MLVGSVGAGRAMASNSSKRRERLKPSADAVPSKILRAPASFTRPFAIKVSSLSRRFSAGRVRSWPFGMYS